MSGAVDSKQSNAAAAALVSPSCPPKSILPHLMFAFRCFCDLWFVFWLICAVTEWLCSWNGQLIVGRFIYWGSWWRRQTDREAGRQAGQRESQHKSCLIEIFHASHRLSPTHNIQLRFIRDLAIWEDSRETTNTNLLSERVELETCPMQCRRV